MPSWKKKVVFGARPEDIFQALTNARDVSRYTHAPCEFDAQPGGKFSLFDGSIHGEFVAVEPNKSYVQRWRFRDWEDDVFSTVKVTLSSPVYGKTVALIEHSKIPSKDKFDNHNVLGIVVAGWEERIIGGISKFIGFRLVDSDESDDDDSD